MSPVGTTDKEKQRWPVPTNRLSSTGDHSNVPTGLAVEIPDDPGTEVPDYSRCVPNGTQLSSPYFLNGALRVREEISSHFGASAGRADARRRDAGDVVAL